MHTGPCACLASRFGVTTSQSNVPSTTHQDLEVGHILRLSQVVSHTHRFIAKKHLDIAHVYSKTTQDHLLHIGCAEEETLCAGKHQYRQTLLQSQPLGPATENRHGWTDKCTLVAVHWHSINVCRCRREHRCAQWSKFVLHVGVSTLCLVQLERRLCAVCDEAYLEAFLEVIV